MDACFNDVCLHCVCILRRHTSESCRTTFSWCRFKNTIIGEVWYLQDILAAGHSENHETKWVLSSVTVTSLLKTHTNQTRGLPSHARFFSRLLISEDGVNGTAIHPASRAGRPLAQHNQPITEPRQGHLPKSSKLILCSPPAPSHVQAATTSQHSASRLQP